MLQADTVRNELKQVIDPEVMLNIVDMGLIYGIDITPENDIQVTMTLTTPHCPMGPEIIHNVESVAGAIEGAGDVSVTITWDPPWSPNMFSDELKDEMRTMGMEFDEDIVNQHPPTEEIAPAAPAGLAAPPPAPQKKRGGLFGWLFGR